MRMLRGGSLEDKLHVSDLGSVVNYLPELNVARSGGEFSLLWRGGGGEFLPSLLRVNFKVVIISNLKSRMKLWKAITISAYRVLCRA